MFWTGIVIGLLVGGTLGAAALAFFMGVKSGDQREPG